MKLSAYLDDLQASGIYWFTSAEAIKALNVSSSALLSAIKRMKKKNRIASPAKNFYLILPPEHFHLGCLPAQEFIPHLMKFWNLDYYAALLTAAEYYGAAHQQPQRFQVMTTSYKPNIQCGKVCVEFIQKKSLENFPVRNIMTPKSTMRVSTPESTAIDLLNYSMHSGGLNPIATVLSELSKAIDPKILHTIADQMASTSCVQRLGYFVDFLGKHELVFVLKQILNTRVSRNITLAADRPFEKSQRNDLWKIYVNFKLELDI